MKKRLIIVLSVVLAVVLAVVLCITAVTDGFTKGKISGKIYRPRNVYEEIWNLVLTEQYTGKQTVLTTATKDAYVDFDFVSFVGVYIPESNTSIHWDWEQGKREGIRFSVYLGDRKNVHFTYNYETKTLSGETDFSYLKDMFLTNYFEWCKASSDFSSAYAIDELGDVTFQCRFPQITTDKVDRISAWVQGAGGERQLNAEETETLIALFNKSRYEREGTGEGGTPEYGVTVYDQNGAVLTINDFHSLDLDFEVTLRNADGERESWCYVNNEELEIYLTELLGLGQDHGRNEE